MKSALDKAYSFIRDICLAVATLLCGKDDKAEYNAYLNGKPRLLAEAILNLGSRIAADSGFDNYSDEINTQYGIYKSVQAELDKIEPPERNHSNVPKIER